MNSKTSMAIAVMAVVLASISAVVKGDTLRDNFNDNSSGSLWKTEVDTINIRENKGRIESQSKTSESGDHESAFVANNWKFDYTQDYSISILYNIIVGPVDGPREAGVGIRITPSGSVDEYSVRMMETSNGLVVHYELWRDGVLEFSKRKSVPSLFYRGRLNVSYSAKRNNLVISISGFRQFRIRNFIDDIEMTGDGLAEVALVATRSSPRKNVRWNWRELWMDDFRLRGVIAE
jgi:hypothetical protein